MTYWCTKENSQYTVISLLTFEWDLWFLYTQLVVGGWGQGEVDDCCPFLSQQLLYISQTDITKKEQLAQKYLKVCWEEGLIGNVLLEFLNLKTYDF